MNKNLFVVIIITSISLLPIACRTALSISCAPEHIERLDILNILDSNARHNIQYDRKTSDVLTIYANGRNGIYKYGEFGIHHERANIVFKIEDNLKIILNNKNYSIHRKALLIFRKTLAKKQDIELPKQEWDTIWFKIERTIYNNRKKHEEL